MTSAAHALADRLLIAYRHRVLRMWWRLDMLANRTTTWTGRRVAAAHNRLTEAEDKW